MNKKLQVFVSSTYTDLVEERQAAVEAILDAGHIPAGMELFKAGKSQMKTIQKWIDESDVYMLILGGRYGSVEEESGLSYTELEYNYALSKNMPVFTIVLEESFLFTKAAAKGKDAVFEKDNIDKYELFLSKVKTNIVKFVKNTEQIVSTIHSQLSIIFDDPDYNLCGWVHYEPKIHRNMEVYLRAIYNKLYELIDIRNGDMSDIDTITNHLVDLKTYYNDNFIECKNCEVELNTIFIIYEVIVIKNNEICAQRNGITTNEDRQYFSVLFNLLLSIVSKLLST